MNDEGFMRECFRLALRGKGHVSPNPMVGAVLVQGGRIIARGYHRKFGGAHAEVDCLRHATGDLSDATLYVNLEPCSHFGKTPPCADVILSRGVGNVVAAMTDPNPTVAGRGLQKLRGAGVKVRVGLLEEEARELNRAFTTQIVARRPYVHVKIAQSGDGRIAGGPGRWISSRESRRRVHAMRAECDVVLVGAGTVKADDPTLTVRLVRGRDPDVVVLDGRLSVRGREKLFVQKSPRRIFVVTTRRALLKETDKVRRLTAHGVTMIGIDSTGERLPLPAVLKELYKKNLGSVLVEGGASVFTQFLKDGLVDEVTMFVSRERFGKGLHATRPGAMATHIRRRLTNVSVGWSGKDFMINVRFDNNNV
jgi:diaminohydroxyphosphoribosylaminopyrimidine deaminase / 5-amino-6-(5-phosphoribosylamino)uracil reductase